MSNLFRSAAPPAKPLAGQPAKLPALLAISAGVMALAPEGEAQIVWSGVLDVHIGIGSGDVGTYMLDVPGNDDAFFRVIGGNGFVVVAYNSNSDADLRFRTAPTGGAASFFKPAVTGQKWGTLGGGSKTGATLGGLENGGGIKGLPSYSHKYALFQFIDNTAGNAVCYGWLDLSGVIGGPDTPSITLHSWAYDASGAEIPAGFTAVPEPQAAALATGAALVLGAAGVRAWRRQRAATMPVD